MSYSVYKLIHVVSERHEQEHQGGVIFYVASGGSRDQAKRRRGVAIDVLGSRTGQ